MDYQQDSKAASSRPRAETARASDSISALLEQGGTPSMARSKALPPPPDWAICEALQLPDVQVSWLAGDGSDRCYYRIRSSASSQSFVLMQLSGDDARQLKEDGYEWIKVGQLLHNHGIYAPQTVAPLPDFAALIIEDYGDVMMETRILSLLSAGLRPAALDLYRQVFAILGCFLQITASGSSHWRERSFDAARLEWELHFFREQFLEGVLAWTLSDEDKDSFRREAALLAAFLAKGSQFFVHRDFHSRNVMVKDRQLAVIDFQDARLGPPTYDLVSVCFDSYIPLSNDERRTLLEEGLTILKISRPDLNLADLQAEWGPMLLQRQLKALGSFGFLTVKKNRGNYLRYVEPALATLMPENVGSDLWPFLSRRLPEELRQRWQARA